MLSQAYHNDIFNDLWGEEENITFLKEVADELSNKVKNRIEFLQNKTIDDE